MNYRHRNMNKRKEFLPKTKKYFIGKRDETVYYDREKFEWISQKKEKATPTNITSPDMIEEFENMIHKDIHVNETETIQYTLDEVTE